ncbi:MAG: hypothetical protein OEW72_05960 [Gammaproteobacteria bacterium]|nr:hypothetical protein [Gammaproteobacteria bacterium]
MTFRYDSGMQQRIVGVLMAVLGCVAMAAHARAADGGPKAPDDTVEATELATAPVQLDGRTLLVVGGISSLTPQSRAEAIAQRLRDIAGDPAIPVESLAVVGSEYGLEIRAGSRPIMLLTEADARREGAPPEIVAQAHKAQFVAAITRYRAERSPERLLRSALVSVAATAALAAAVWLTLILVVHRHLQDRAGLRDRHRAGHGVPVPAGRRLRGAARGYRYSPAWCCRWAPRPPSQTSSPATSRPSVACCGSVT